MNTADELLAARASGEPKRIAAALVRRADALVDDGELEAARALLDEAAEIHQGRELPVDQARCLVFAATLCRAGGDLAGASWRAREAERIAPEATAPRVSAATELGEIATLEGAFPAAAECYGRALTQGTAAGLTGFSRAALHRKRAQALASAGRVVEVLPDLKAARALYREAGEAREVVRTEIELASALESLGRTDDELLPLIAEIRAQASASEDYQVLADVELLVAARAVSQGRVDDALAGCRLAREHALAGVVPVAYTAAAMTIAELCESTGDRVAAYEALAVGWATLGDLLGADVGKATFAPKVQEQRQRWGDDGFVAARDAYYERRKAEQAS